MTWRPCTRREFVRKLRELGFTGPEPGTRHAVMFLGAHKQVIPRNREYSVPQLRLLLRQVVQKLGREIGSDEWETL